MTTPTHTPTPFDPSCGRLAHDIPNVIYGAMSEFNDETDGKTWDELTELEQATVAENYARTDGTYNPNNGHFLCDDCYIKAGQPSSPTGWKCP